MEIAFLLHWIRYNILDQHLSQYLPTVSHLTFYINLEDILNTFRKYQRDNQTYTATESNIYQLTSLIINTIAHYRVYAKSRRKTSSIILYGTFPLERHYLLNMDIVDNYRNTYFYNFNDNMLKQEFIKLIGSSFNIAKEICKYIKNAYIIDSNRLEGSVIPSILLNNMKSKSNLSIMITKDRYDYQYANHNVIIFRPIPKSAPYVITKDNLLNRLMIEYDIIQNDINFTPAQYSILLSFLGDRTRSIPHVFGYSLKKTLKTLNKLISKNILTNDISSIMMVLDYFSKDVSNTLRNNFSTINIDAQVSSAYKSDVISIVSQINDSFDNHSLRVLNDKYFNEYPLKLIELLEPENKNTSIFI